MKTPTMIFPLPVIQKLLTSLWQEWSIPAIVMTSLAFQTILVFLAPVRKRSNSSLTFIVIWSVYLLADYFATFAIGLMNTRTYPSHIIAFWAPFLLLHLGGPHTITAFDLEDNDLWHRQFMTLIVQVSSVLLVFYKNRIYENYRLLIPTGIIFVTGIIKYVERTRSLYLGSRSYIRGSAFKKDSKKKSTKKRHDNVPKKEKEAAISCRIRGRSDETDREMDMIHRAYINYKLFKGFIVDHTLIHMNNDNKLKDLDYKKAFELLETELNFVYDALFTKMAAVQWMSSFGYGYRFFGHVLLLATALAFFMFDKPRNKIDPLDISISYILLGGAIVLDSLALLKLVFSEWTVALMMDKRKNYKKEQEKKWCASYWIERFQKNLTIMRIINTVTKWVSLETRWSRGVRQYSFIRHTVKSQSSWCCVDRLIEYFGLTGRMDIYRHTLCRPLEWSLMKSIFEHTNEMATIPKEEEHKSLPLWLLPGTTEKQREKQYQKLIDEQGYANCALICHIATEICYFTIPSEEGDPNPDICRTISEYLMFFIALERNMTSTVPGHIGVRLKDMCRDEIKDTRTDLSEILPRRRRITIQDRLRHFIAKLVAKLMDIIDCLAYVTVSQDNNPAYGKEESRLEKTKREWKDRQLKALIQDLELSPPTKRKPERSLDHCSEETTTEEESKSKLKEAFELARHWKSLCSKNSKGPSSSDIENQNQPNPKTPQELWEAMSHVWVGLLLYGARHCRGDVYYLNKGGELITFVRLLMVHFGLINRFKDEASRFDLKSEVNFK